MVFLEFIDNVIELIKRWICKAIAFVIFRIAPYTLQITSLCDMQICRFAMIIHFIFKEEFSFI